MLAARNLLKPRLARHFSAAVQAPTEVSALGNGLRVATESGYGETATVGVWVDTGSRYETDATNGVAHFLEHIIFKGTKSRKQSELEMEIENMGGHLNAYTSREQTVYYAKVFKEDVPKAMDILSDILLNSNLSTQSVERERDVILREMEEVDGQMEEVIMDRLHEVAYRGTPLARTILGPVENIKGITADDVAAYQATNYTAERMVVAAAGAVDHDQMTELSDKFFGGVPATPPSGSYAPWEATIFSGSDVKIYDDDLPLAHVAIAFEGLPWTDPDTYALMMMQALLGTYDKNQTARANMSSKLCQALSKYDLAQTCVGFNTCYSDSGLFGLYATGSGKGENLDDLSYWMMEECVRLCFTVSDEDCARAANQLKTQLLMQLDGTSPIAEDIGRQLLTTNRRIPVAESIMRIDAVTPDDIKRVANKVIWDKEIAIASIGPVKYMPDLNKMRRRTYWNAF